MNTSKAPWLANKTVAEAPWWQVCETSLEIKRTMMLRTITSYNSLSEARAFRNILPKLALKNDFYLICRKHDEKSFPQVYTECKQL